MFYYNSFLCLINAFFLNKIKTFLIIFIVIKNAMLSRHNFILEIAVHMKCNQGVGKLNKFYLL